MEPAFATTWNWIKRLHLENKTKRSDKIKSLLKLINVINVTFSTLINVIKTLYYIKTRIFRKYGD